ncbi:uncharacterized protein LOC129610833 [Condylostylus longicornis]|uniref:uncharacterized protein LOC129610833 n=1 Tax=Condylostylus longicornis TaxID=2530218 RepID=UPI00244E5504|nr:uncharacterized protein LOC129610833 [Condylostylus longicornis]
MFKSTQNISVGQEYMHISVPHTIPASAYKLRTKVITPFSKMQSLYDDDYDDDDNDDDAFERKILRQIYGPIRLSNNEYRRRFNDELYALTQNEDIVKFIESQRLRWAGHVIRMPENRDQIQILNARALLTRARGRPRNRWLDDIEFDARKLEIINWRTTARDRSNWREIVKKAKAHQGL